MMILGLGAGGCGLASLAELLKRQHRSQVTKEAGIRYTGWCDSLLFELAMADDWRKSLDAGECDLAGDVAFYHLPYAYEIARRHDDCRIVWLGREHDRMVAHLLKGANRSHPWFEHFGDQFRWNPLGVTYPKMGIPDKTEAVRLYVEFYHRAATILNRHLKKKMQYFSTNHLDSEAGQLEILKYCGVEQPITIAGGINVNP